MRFGLTFWLQNHGIWLQSGIPMAKFGVQTNILVLRLNFGTAITNFGFMGLSQYNLV